MNRPWLVLVESNTTGTGQDFVEAARRHGLRPILLTRTPERYPYVAGLGLDVRLTDTGHADAVLDTCRELRPEGLSGVTTSSEMFVHTAAVVARHLGLAAPDADAIAVCRDKVAQRRCLAAHGIPGPDFVACGSVREVQAATAHMGTPVVVKPSRGTGSQGVRACVDPLGAGEWAQRLFSGDGLPRAAEVLVEREVYGPEYSVEVMNGAVVGITAKHTGSAPYFVETGHDFPAPATERLSAALRSVTLAAIHAVGLETGPAHLELRMGGGRPHLIEINPRLAGGLIPRLIRRATCRDLVDEVIAGAVARPPAATPRQTRYASIRFLVPPPGLVTSVDGIDRARRTRHVVEVACFVSPGMRLSAEHSFADRRGHVMAVADRAEDAVAAVESARAHIEIAVSPPEGVASGQRPNVSDAR